MTLAEEDGSLWVWAKAACTIDVNCELCGFGSGGYSRQAEATDIMSDSSSAGRWLEFAIKDPNCFVVLEKGRKDPEHLQDQPFFNKAWTKLSLTVAAQRSTYHTKQWL